MFGYVARSLIPLDQLLAVLKAATGWNTSWWDVIKVGERALAMAKEYNHRQGLTINDDRLPDMFYKAIAKGPFDGKATLDKKQFETAIASYYAMAGWNPDGGVTRDKLDELELDWL